MFDYIPFPVPTHTTGMTQLKVTIKSDVRIAPTRRQYFKDHTLPLLHRVIEGGQNIHEPTGLYPGTQEEHKYKGHAGRWSEGFGLILNSD